MCELSQSPNSARPAPRSNANPDDAAGREERGISRREFLAAAGLVAGAVGGASLPGCASDAPRSGSPGERVLIKGGVVLTMDAKLGDFDRADVLIEGTKIVAVGPNLQATATVIEASGMIVMPGFVDSHRHIWQGPLRNILPDGTLGQYFKSIGGTARAAYRPEDVYAGDLLSSWGAMNAGITTLLDWSHISNTPEHSDAAIKGLVESGIRGVYGYGFGGAEAKGAQYPQDIRRLRKQYFSSSDQLVTLALATAFNPDHWRIAREVGAPITLHANGTNELMPLANAKLMGPDVTYIHCCRLSAEEWKFIADTGGGVSMASPVEMEMGHGIPPIQQALDLKLPTSLSNDVETSVAAEFFTQMRTIFVLQRMQVLARERAGEKNLPPLMTVKQVLEIATIGGARVNHLDKKVGSLTPGKEADIVLLAANRINVMPLNNAYAAVVQGMDTSNVDTVFVAGKVKKWKGELVGVKLAELQVMAERSRDYLVAQAKWPRTVLGGYAPGH